MLLSKRIIPTVLLIALLLSACGFRLQGVDQYSETLATTYIDTPDRYSLFYQQLLVQLDQGGIDVVDSPVHANAIIRVNTDDSGQNILTVSARNVPTEMDIYYKVHFSVWVNGAEVLPEQSLYLHQSHTYDETTVLGKNRESEAIRAALADNLVRQVSQQLALL